MVKNAKRNKITSVAVSEKDIKSFIGSYAKALENVAEIVEQ